METGRALTMTKLKKVIKGLECCRAQLSSPLCEECPYKDDVQGTCDTLNNIFSDALELLKAQEPVKPVPAINDVGDWLCGNCYQSVVGEEELDASGFVPVKFNFCPNCGREVKWG